MDYGDGGPMGDSNYSWEGGQYVEVVTPSGVPGDTYAAPALAFSLWEALIGREARGDAVSFGGLTANCETCAPMNPEGQGRVNLISTPSMKTSARVVPIWIRVLTTAGHLR